MLEYRQHSSRLEFLNANAHLRGSGRTSSERHIGQREVHRQPHRCLPLQQTRHMQFLHMPFPGEMTQACSCDQVLMFQFLGI